LVDPATDKITGFVPFGERSRKQREMGLEQRDETAPAYAKLVGSSACSVHVHIYRTDRGY
jgi:hypothetical protein